MVGKKTVKEEKLALITYTGSLSEIEDVLAEVSEFIRGKKLEKTGPASVIFYTAPLRNDGRFDAGFPVKGEVEGEGKVSIVKIPEHRVIYTEYTDDREAAYSELVEYVEKNGLDVIGSPREVYHENSREIQFPVMI